MCLERCHALLDAGASEFQTVQTSDQIILAADDCDEASDQPAVSHAFMVNGKEHKLILQMPGLASSFL